MLPIKLGEIVGSYTSITALPQKFGLGTEGISLTSEMELGLLEKKKKN